MKNDRLIDVRTITEDGPAVHFRATESERKEIADRFDIPALRVLTVDGSFSVSDFIIFTGEMYVEADRICSTTLNSFVEKTNVPVQIGFSEIESDNDDPVDMDIFPIVKGKINILDVFSEVLGLNLNPFPKSTSAYLDYIDPADSETESPFAALKNLKKKG